MDATEPGRNWLPAERRARVLWALCLVAGTLSGAFPLLLPSVLIGLQLLIYKAGRRSAIVCGAMSAVLMTGARLVAYRVLLEGTIAMTAADLLVPAACVVALGALNLANGPGMRPAWQRVAAAYVPLALVATPALQGFLADPTVRGLLDQELAAMIGGMGVEELGKGLIDASVGLMVRIGGIGLLLMVLSCWYAATRFQRRAPVQWYAALALANFRIAEYVVWPLLAGLALFGAGRVVGMPPAVDIAVTVFTLGVVFLYFLQGLGIISAFFVRQRNPGMQRIGLPLVLAILFLVPGFNVVLLVGIPLVGVLELWVRMRPATHAAENAEVESD